MLKLNYQVNFSTNLDEKTKQKQASKILFDIDLYKVCFFSMHLTSSFATIKEFNADLFKKKNI